MIRLEDVSYHYASAETDGVRNISMEVKTGECVLLCGQSGCGKTTVVRMVNGLIPHFFNGTFSGEVTVAGMNPGKTKMYQLAKRVGSVFQNPRNQFFNMDTDSEIAFGLENQAVSNEQMSKRVEAAVTELRIENLLGRNLFSLSGGEKQKIAFASVYTMNPDIYVLDEPFSNLDTKSIEELCHQLKQIKAAGKTILIAEHRLSYLMDIADRVIRMEDGQIRESYPIEEFRALTSDDLKERGLREINRSRIFTQNNQDIVPSPMLEIRNLAAGYQKHSVFTQLDFQASPGDVVGIIGANGVGKTTFCRTLCGMMKELQGEILWQGKQQKSKARLRRSYMVMQDVNYQLFAESVEQECVLGIKNPDKEAVNISLDRLGLIPYRKRHPGTLSGGQKQRTAVAVSMAARKEVLIFDEPTSGLDYQGMTQVAEVIHMLAGLGKILFVVTHDYEFAAKVCTRFLPFHG